jgi:hypothetical protein
MGMIWTMYRGQLGKVLRGQLKANNVAVDLSQFDSVSVQVARTLGTLVVDKPAVIDVDQSVEVLANGRSVSGKGWLTFTTEATAAALAKNELGYYLSFKGMDGATPAFFPLNRRAERTYGKLVVQEPLS